MNTSTASRRRLLSRLVPLLLMLTGVAVLLYPVAATLVHNHAQRQTAQRYPAQIQTLPDTARLAALARARAYNAGLTGLPLLDPWLEQVARSAEYRRYEGLLADTDVMARLSVPAIGVDLPIRHGTSEQVLATGLGHLYGTALPVGGPGTHAVITGHTGMSTASMFDRLVEVGDGDLVHVNVYGERLTYEVDDISVVLPHEADGLRPVADRDLLTLLTCTPYGANSHRLLVRGHRVAAADDQAAAAPAAPPRQLEPWMWWLLLPATATLGALAIMAVAAVRRRPRRPRASS